MPDSERLQNMLDKFEIQEVVAAACYSRDRGDWETLRDCYHPDGCVTVSWHSGPVDEFIERSVKMMASRDAQEFTKHVNANPRVRLNGERAIIEYDVILHNRRLLDGYAFDFHTWSCYLDQVEKRGGRWRIFNRTAIYEKDRMDAHNPREIPDSFLRGHEPGAIPPQHPLPLLAKRADGADASRGDHHRADRKGSRSARGRRALARRRVGGRGDL